MFDPRKEVRRPDLDQQNAMRDRALGHLLKCTEAGAKDLGCTGASFVLIGIGIWLSETAELDARATSQMLEALAKLYDPNSNDRQRARAEKKRRAAVSRIFAALDVAMADPAGRA